MISGSYSDDLIIPKTLTQTKTFTAHDGLHNDLRMAESALSVSGLGAVRQLYLDESEIESIVANINGLPIAHIIGCLR